MDIKILTSHPCFSHTAHFKNGRIHLPVAPKCNISCRFCDRKYDCANESRPGVTSAVLSPKEALLRLQEALDRNPDLKVAGIAGPGEPLFNDETFRTLKIVHEQFPELILCVSTNGLLLSDRLDRILDCGVSTLTVTINALDFEHADWIYNDVLSLDPYPESRRDRISLLLEKQQKGLYEACRCGLTVKINTVLIPGINDDQIENISKLGKNAGVSIMNIMPLIPCGSMADRKSPSPEEIKAARDCASGYVPQFMLCRQCRADACGIPGKEGR